MGTNSARISGFTAPIRTTAEQHPVLVMGMGGQPRERDKASPEGEPTFVSNTILMGERDGEYMPLKTSSVHVIEPAATYVVGTLYRAEGRVYVQPYVPDGGRLTYSITVERLVPVQTAQAAA